MADDNVEAAVRYVPLAYFTPENHAAQKSLTLLADRHANLPNLIENNDKLPQSNRTAKAKYRFVLSIDNSGDSCNGSWALGKGDIRYSVDLRLCPPRSRYLIGPLLGTIHIHPESGAFLLQNKSWLGSIEYVDAGLVLGYQEIHVLFRTRNHLRFGPLDYIFEINAESETDFSLARREYMRRYIYDSTADIESSVSLMCRLLDPLPKPTQFSLGDIILHRTVSWGAFGVVRVGVHKRTGEVVVCKTITCLTRDIVYVKNEITIASQSKPDHLLATLPRSLPLP